METKTKVLIVVVILALVGAFLAGFFVVPRGVSLAEVERLGAEASAVHRAEIDELLYELENRLADGDNFQRQINSLQSALSQNQIRTEQLSAGIIQNLSTHRASMVDLKAQFEATLTELQHNRTQLEATISGAVGAELASLQSLLGIIDQHIESVTASIAGLTIRIADIDALLELAGVVSY